MASNLRVILTGKVRVARTKAWQRKVHIYTYDQNFQPFIVACSDIKKKSANSNNLPCFLWNHFSNESAEIEMACSSSTGRGDESLL